MDKTLEVTRASIDFGTRQEEAELLLRSVRTPLEPADVSAIRAQLAGSLDWATLLQMARRHGTIPLLYSTFSAVGLDLVPGPAREQLTRLFQDSVRRSTFMAGELGRILDVLESRAIQAVPYKGPVLAEALYDNLAMRSYADLDILVRPDDVVAARDALVPQGYRPRFQLTHTQESAYLRSRYAYELERSDGLFFVEIHWRPAPKYFSFDLDLDEVWRRLGQTCFQGRAVRMLAPEDLLLMLCVHGAKHRWERLSWICDVAALMRVHSNLDWCSLLERSRRLGAERLLLVGVLLAGKLVRVATPAVLAARAQADPAVTRLAEQAGRQLFEEFREFEDESESSLAVRLFHLRTRERLRDRLRYSVRLATTPNVGEWGLLPLPAVLSWLYRPLRPLRVAKKYATELLKSRH